MKKVIVTGANGFVGHAVVEQLCKQGVFVIALVHSVQQRTYDAGLVKLVPFELSDAFRLPQIIKDRDIDVFYHFAWDGCQGDDLSKPARQLQNVQWSVDCLRAAHAMGCNRFVGVGSVSETEAYLTANRQESRPKPGYIYGGAKLAAHVMLKSMAASLGIEFVWGRLINAYGAGEKSPRLINQTIRTMLGSTKPLSFTTGEQNYDFVYVDDAARAFCLLGDRGVPFKNYAIGSGEARPLKEFLYILRDTLEPERKFNLGAIPYTGVNIPLDDLSIRELQADTGFSPEVPFADGIRKTAVWISEEMGCAKY